MFRRNLTVVFKPSKNNALQLPASYFNAVQEYQERGCIRLTYQQNKRDHCMAWAPQSGNLRDTEIGINSNVAKAIGLKEGSIVTCSLVEDAPPLQSITVVSYSKKDWDMLEASSYRIQSTLLDQTRVVTADQKLVIWINPVMTLVVNVRRLSPNIPFGRLCTDTEVKVLPFNAITAPITNGTTSPITNGDALRDVPKLSTADLEKRLSAADSLLRNGYGTESAVAATNGSGGGIMRSATAAAVLSTSNGRHALEDATSRLWSTAQLENDLRTLAPFDDWFRLIGGEWEADAQLYDVYTNTHNLPAGIDTAQIFELSAGDADFAAVQCYVNVKVLAESEPFPRNGYLSLECSTALLRTLGLTELVQVRLVQRERRVCKQLDRIELAPAVHGLTPAALRDLEHEFKQRLVRAAAAQPMLLNQGELFRLDGERLVTVRLLPERLPYACVDAAVMRTCRVVCVPEVRATIAADAEQQRPKGLRQSESFVAQGGGLATRYEYVRLAKFEAVIERVAQFVVTVMGLDRSGHDVDRFNVVVSGKSKSGKTQISKRILEALAAKPYHCYTALVDCTKYKGRKPESIEREFRDIFDYGMLRAPAVVVLDNLDVLTPKAGEQSPDAEYNNRVSDVIRNLIDQYTARRRMCIIATATNARALNKRVQKARGSYTFHDLTAETPKLELPDREQVLRDMTAALRSPRKLNYRRIAAQTEGYGIGDLVELAQRAVFFAHKQCPLAPELSMEHLRESLHVTNAYCLQGIENINASDGGGGGGGGDAETGTESSAEENSDDEEADSDDEAVRQRRSQTDPDAAAAVLAGLGQVTKVLEEVLIWPARYQHIFANSPLRNQAGVLLFGAPGTGKTYAVGKLARMWRLRLISVKGPELLAKFIGQSEENVRNVFDRARKAKPCVLFFDEFDSLAPRRGHDSTGVTDRVVNQLLTELDGVQGLDGVIVIAATSRPDLLDGALLRSGRIDRMVEIPLPDRQARLEILTVLAKTLHLATDVDLGVLADRAEHFTGADLQSVLTSANMAAVKQHLKLAEANPAKIVFIHQQHLLDGMLDTRPSLQPADLIKYTKIYARFTSSGGQTAVAQDILTQRATLA